MSKHAGASLMPKSDWAKVTAIPFVFCRVARWSAQPLCPSVQRLLKPHTIAPRLEPIRAKTRHFPRKPRTSPFGTSLAVLRG
jgi:hypothetical protein